MSIHIYNSLTRKKDEFKPVRPPAVNMYTCGVTVYDESHIGHARSLYIFDLMRRYLEYRHFKVNFVRNITDIDDKIINRANELKISWIELVDKYIKRYYEDLDTLGIKKADVEPRATENIPDMIKYIEELINNGYAYESGGDVYFNVRKFASYGKLSGQGIDQMEKGVRIEVCDLKKDHPDFALWKKSKPGEPYWHSPWGNGRPGWHIECSVMSRKFLKADTLDIHAGGRDLIFPHHENEIAQAEALTGKPFANYWIHHGLLTINGQKMSKSLGNFITIKDFAAKYNDIDILKMIFLSSHYSHPVDYNEDKINESRLAIERIIILMDKIEVKKTRDEKRWMMGERIEQIDNIKERFIKAMDDDFNTPQALACVFEIVNLANKNIDDFGFISDAGAVLKGFLSILGISLQKAKINISDEEEIEAKIRERNRARDAKDYVSADKIRKELEKKGIILEDSKEGTIWRKKI